MKKKIISIVIPLYNEALNIQATFAKIQNDIKPLLDEYNFEYICVDDGSTDNTLAELKKLASSNKNVRYIEFSRNFGKESATTAGLQYAKGDAVILIDADGQHPPKYIIDFIRKWREGFQVVIGVRTENEGEGFVKKYGSKLFYKLLDSLTDGNTVAGSTDFRLLDRRVVDEFNLLTERGRITRGLVDWLGFRRYYISFSANKRTAGRASYSVNKLIKLALHAFVSQSTKPLQAVGVLGLFVMVLSIIAGVALVLEKYVLNDSLGLGISGTAILAVFLSFLVGIVLACQGLMALYIESIHNETQNRPLFVVASESD